MTTTKPQSTTEDPDRIRLVKRGGTFDGHWYYPDAAIMPYESEVEYVRADRKYFCSCGGALTAEEYIVHYFQMGHDRGDPAVTASAAPVVDNLQRRLYEECVTANWDPERKNTFAEEIAHLHEELSEAFRAWRRYEDCEVREVNGKLEGVPIEFADALIGMFYNAELYGFDLLAAVERKHQFNLTRNYVTEGRQLHAPAAATAAPVESEEE